MTDYPLMGVVWVTLPIFLNFAPNHIFGVGETSQFKCHVLIDTEVYQYMNDRLLLKGMCSE